MFSNIAVDFEIHKHKDGEQNGELRDANASRSEVINDEPRIREPSNFGAEKSADERDEGSFVFVALYQNVVRSSITNDKLRDDNNNRIG